MKFLILVQFILTVFTLPAQIRISGVVSDSNTKKGIPSVNISIKQKNTATSSLKNGSFSISIPKQYENDILTFSIIGYEELNIPINNIESEQPKLVELQPKVTQLKEVTISTPGLELKKFGIKKSPLLQFTEYSHNPNDTFEIAQLIKLDRTPSKITSINLYTGGSLSDSVTFRVHFYAFNGKEPGNKIIDKPIIQTCYITPGWLSIDLSKYNIRLHGDVVVALEYIPSFNKKNNPIAYTVKIGGPTRTFVKSRGWMGDSTYNNAWEIPPAHYRIFVTALVPGKSKNLKEDELEEDETLPTHRMFSRFVHDSFYVYVNLPKEYDKKKNKKYPVVYLLDGNIYFDEIGRSIKQLNKEKLLPETILVGIGYINFFTADSLRDRDYTFVPALAEDSSSMSGGGDKFLAFIENELIPFIDKSYKADTANLTIMGHSLGGHFVLDLLLRTLEGKNNLFSNFIAGSPNLYYHNFYILQRSKEISYNLKGPKRVYMTIGGLEINEDNGTYLNSFNSLANQLILQELKNLKIKHEIYPNKSHMGTAISSFEKGLLFITNNN